MLADRRLGAVIARDPPTSFDSWLRDYVGDSDASNGTACDRSILSLVPSRNRTHRCIGTCALNFRVATEISSRKPAGAVLTHRALSLRRHIISSDAARTTKVPPLLPLSCAGRCLSGSHGRDANSAWAWCFPRNGRRSFRQPFSRNAIPFYYIVSSMTPTRILSLGWSPTMWGGLLRELPSLPSRQAVLLGWAAPIPVLVEVDELPEDQRPRSADPDFWDVWTLAKERPVDWAAIAKHWSGDQVD